MSEDVTGQSLLADTTVNHVTLALDKDTFAWWWRVGEKFCLTSNSQIAAFLLHSFQVKGAGEISGSCRQCGGPLSWLCVPCLSQFHHSRSSQHDVRHKLLPDRDIGTTDTVKQEDRTSYKNKEGESSGEQQEEDGHEDQEEENENISTTRQRQRLKQQQRTEEKGRRKEFTQTRRHRQKRKEEEEEDVSLERRPKRKQREPQPTRKKVKVDDDCEDIEEEDFEYRPKHRQSKRQLREKVHVGDEVVSFETMNEDFDNDHSFSDGMLEVRKPARKRGRPRKIDQQGGRPRKGERMGRTNNVDEQKEKKDRGGSHICDACGKILATVSSLNKHKRIMHTSEFKPHMCELCCKAFRSVHKLKLHGMRHSGEKAHPCDVCGKAFDSRYHMKRHRLIHEGVKAHLCDTCGKKFLHKSALKQHRQLHTEQKKHLCDVCSKTFFRASNLKEHKLFHSGQKPHCCHVCAQHFTLLSHLKRHMLRVHMKDKGPIKGKMAQVPVAGGNDGGGGGSGGGEGRGGDGGVTQIPDMHSYSSSDPNPTLHDPHHHLHTHPHSLTNPNPSGLKMSDSHQLGHAVSGSPPQSETNRAMLENMQVHSYDGTAQLPDHIMGGPSLLPVGSSVGPVFSHNEFGCLFPTIPYHRSVNPYSTHSSDSQA